MSKHMPPVPPDNRSPNGPRQAPQKHAGPDPKNAERMRNVAQQGRQGNIKQNTTHQGHQQDR